MDNYQILDVIGHGAFGFVKLAKKKDTGKYFAIKIMKKEELVKET